VLELGEDFLTGIVFVIVYLATNNIVALVWITIAIGIWQFALLDFRGRSVDVMQYLSIWLVVALGAISFAFDDLRFVLLKLSAVQFATEAEILLKEFHGRLVGDRVLRGKSEVLRVFEPLRAAPI